MTRDWLEQAIYGAQPGGVTGESTRAELYPAWVTQAAARVRSKLIAIAASRDLIASTPEAAAALWAAIDEEGAEV